MRTTRRLAVTAFLSIAAIIAAMVGAGSALAAPYPPGTATTLVGDKSVVAQGGTLTLVGTGYAQNSQVTLTLHSATVAVGTVQSDDNGTFTTTITIPAGFPTGSHYVEGVDTENDSATYSFSVTSSGTANGNGNGNGNGGLAGTGVAVVGIGALGVVLLVGGGLMLMAGRRRKTTAV